MNSHHRVEDVRNLIRVSFTDRFRGEKEGIGLGRSICEARHSCGKKRSLKGLGPLSEV